MLFYISYYIFVSSQRNYSQQQQSKMTQITITAEVKRRIEQAIRETEVLLNNELKYSVEFQKQDSIERYTQHIARLKNMIL